MNALEKATERRGKLIGYVRVSTILQNTDRQLEGVTLDKKFTDHASGKDANRPELKRCLEYVREDDTLIVHSMDRLARNVEDMLRIVRDLTDKGVTVVFLKENLKFAGDENAFNRMMLTLLAAFAEFERNLGRERQREGIELAKARGAFKGRAPSLKPEEVELMYQLIDNDVPKARIARQLGIARRTVYTYLDLRPALEGNPQAIARAPKKAVAPKPA